MSLDFVPQSYGKFFDELTLPERLAVERYVTAMSKIYPDRASMAIAGPGNEGVVYVRIPFPEDDDLNIEVHETLSEISSDLLLETGVSIVLMPLHSNDL